MALFDSVFRRCVSSHEPPDDISSMSPLSSLVMSGLARNDWKQLSELCGTAEQIPSAIKEILQATDAKAAEKAYWKLDNHVVVQGGLFTSSVAVTEILFSALASMRLAPFIKSRLYDLLIQILSGWTHRDAVAAGECDIERHCSQVAFGGLWLLYRELNDDDSERVRDLIHLVDPNLTRQAIEILRRDPEFISFRSLVAEANALARFRESTARKRMTPKCGATGRLVAQHDGVIQLHIKLMPGLTVFEPNDLVTCLEDERLIGRVVEFRVERDAGLADDSTGLRCMLILRDVVRWGSDCDEYMLFVREA